MKVAPCTARIDSVTGSVAVARRAGRRVDALHLRLVVPAEPPCGDHERRDEEDRGQRDACASRLPAVAAPALADRCAGKARRSAARPLRPPRRSASCTRRRTAGRRAPASPRRPGGTPSCTCAREAGRTARPRDGAGTSCAPSCAPPSPRSRDPAACGPRAGSSRSRTSPRQCRRDPRRADHAAPGKVATSARRGTSGARTPRARRGTWLRARARARRAPGRAGPRRRPPARPRRRSSCRIAPCARRSATTPSTSADGDRAAGVQQVVRLRVPRGDDRDRHRRIETARRPPTERDRYGAARLRRRGATASGTDDQPRRAGSSGRSRRRRRSA